MPSTSAAGDHRASMDAAGAARGGPISRATSSIASMPKRLLVRTGGAFQVPCLEVVATRLHVIPSCWADGRPIRVRQMGDEPLRATLRFDSGGWRRFAEL